MAEQTLAQALRGLKGSGLQGSYLHQVLNELTARQGDAAAAVPALLADAGAERAQAFQKARTQLVGDRAQMQQTAASKFNQLLKEADTNASGYLKEQSKGPSEGLTNASIAFKDAMATWIKNPVVSVKGAKGYEEVRLHHLNPLQTPDQWRAFAVGLEKHYDGVSLADAMTVVNRFLATRQRQLKQVWSHKRAFKAVGPLVKATTPIYQPFNAAR